MSTGVRETRSDSAKCRLFSRRVGEGRSSLIDEAVGEYKAKHPRSGSLYEESVNLFPAGVSHNGRSLGLPEVGAFPFYVTEAKGPFLYDIDGNAYLDYWCGHYALILGHAPEIVLDAIREQLPKGTMWGLVHEKQIELAKIVRRHVRCAERMRFTNTGSEATLYAVRLARGYTRKRVIVKMEGGWHGGNPELNVAVNYPYESPESLGILEEQSRYTVAIPFNDPDNRAISDSQNRLFYAIQAIYLTIVFSMGIVVLLIVLFFLQRYEKKHKHS